MTYLNDSNINSFSENNFNLVFVDSNLDNYSDLIAGNNHAEIVLLDSTRDGVEQITEALANYSNLDSIQILSHGQAGSLQLGSATIDNNNLENYSAQIVSWSESLVENGDILLYGCNFASNTAGIELVQELSQLTNADVAASDDLTGSSKLYGDWELEITTGDIEAELAIDALSIENYNSVLAAEDLSFNYDNFTNVEELQLNRHAQQSGNVLRLTDDISSRAGSAFYDEAVQIESNTSFSTQFQFQIGGDPNGADGFTFMLQNNAAQKLAVGMPGGNIGYGGIGQSIAIAFDTYKNPYDTNDNHISLLSNGITNVALAEVDAPFDLNSGEILNAWIDYDGTDDLLEVYLSNTTVKPTDAILSTNIDITSSLGDSAIVGFSAGTGRLSNSHDILDWSFNSYQEIEPVAEKTELFRYESFANIDNLEINGDAASVNGAIRLTPAQNNQAGSFFFDEPIRVNDDTSFSTQFQFQIDNGTDGADGFTFMLQNDRFGDQALGVHGSGVGYRGIEQSIAIEFDTHQGLGDPNNNHISILSNGDTANSILDVSSPFDLNSGEILDAWIDYNGENNELQVFLSNTSDKPQTPLLSTTIDLSGTVGDRARVGFSAATGGRVNEHSILNWEFDSSDMFAPEGDFSDVIAWPTVAVHAGLTPDGKVLTYGLDANFGVEGDQVNTRFVIWDPKQGNSETAFNVLNMSHPVDSAFCSGMMLLPNGQMLIVGGAIQGNRNAGNDVIHLYDYRTGEIKMLGDDGHHMMMGDGHHMMMSDNSLVEARWYPTMTTLTDGRILIQGGRDAVEVDGVFTPEIYTPGVGSELLPGATSDYIYSNAGSQWWYPRSWVAPNGQVFGITGDDMYYLDPTGDGSITPAGEFLGQSRGITSTAVMYEPGKILQAGKGREASIVDINGDTPVVTSGGSPNYLRFWGDSTVLPDGTVFVSGGSLVDNVAEGVAYAAEIWNPEDNSWTVVDSAQNLRLYHSTSLLLPDATVLTAGGTTASFDDEALSGEIYRPAYLYDESGQEAERPTITSDEKVVDWNQTMSATVGNATEISRVSLVAFGAVTHSFDMGQRFMELDFTQSGNQLTISTPESANIAPPGYYMVFAFDNNGVPSEAHIVQFVA